MSDIVAQLQVISRESGCLIDLSAIVDLSVCPKIDIKATKPHKVEKKEDYVCITPSEPSALTKRCDKKTCYEVRDEVCNKSTVILDLQIMVILGLITEVELEAYLKTTGAMGKDDKLNMGPDDKCKIDPLLSATAGEDGSLLDLEVLGPDGLIDLDINGKDFLNVGGKGGLLDIAALRPRGQRLVDVDVLTQKDKKPAAIDVDVLTHSRRGQRLVDVDVLTQKDKKPAAIDVDVLTHSRRGQRLADVDVLTQKDKKPAAIDVDVLTHSRRGHRLADVDVLTQKDEKPAPIDVDVLTHPRRSNDRLIDVDVLSEKECDEALIDVDVLTKGNCNGKGGNNGSNGGKPPTKPTKPTTPTTPGDNGSTKPTTPGGNNGGNTGVVPPKKPCKTCAGGKDGLITHYQPICKKGFKKVHRDAAEKCHAKDVNHCLAICNSKSALATVGANVQVGDIANIMLCAAIEFDQSEEGDNCRFHIAPETEPANDDQLEEKPNCVSFVRN